MANTTNTPYTAAYIPGALNYEWSLSPETAGTLTSDANDVDIEWNTEFSGYCYLSVKAINEYGESEYSETLEIYIDYLIGLENIDFEQISIYPNPSQNHVQVNGASDVENYSIKDISGKTLLQGSNNDQQGKIQIDISSLPNGLYFIIFENNEVISSQKLIKM
ncbi:T9SS type A sorting domain-containing protein [Lentimicrobium sp. L6]|uniref:T9SS type A sorting domain-containing protein n=1 Tax=Lentimicrobium sp. L6 TaxID=2735916 RepID=UPI00155677BE|nr:T9SS type A sorting domain-containing protein [Lentimicrobium sp. L6]NPD84525.1 T9SS type A sorting domain-containing protein [Lentimicrobium sp. L6]